MVVSWMTFGNLKSWLLLLGPCSHASVGENFDSEIYFRHEKKILYPR